MPNLVVEAAARDHVYHLRTRELPLDIYGPGTHVLTPLLRKLDHAVAAVLEHLTDVSGGVEGITHTYAVLMDHCLRLPGAGFADHDGATPALECAHDALHFDPLVTPEAPTPVF